MIRRIVFLAVTGLLFTVLAATSPAEPGPAASAQVAGAFAVSVLAAWAVTGAFPRGRDGHGRHHA